MFTVGVKQQCNNKNNYDAIGMGAWQTVHAMFRHFFITLQSDILSTVTSGFLKQLIILKSFNSVFYLVILFCDEQTYIAVSQILAPNKQTPTYLFLL